MSALSGGAALPPLAMTPLTPTRIDPAWKSGFPIVVVMNQTASSWMPTNAVPPVMERSTKVPTPGVIVTCCAPASVATANAARIPRRNPEQGDVVEVVDLAENMDPLQMIDPAPEAA